MGHPLPQARHGVFLPRLVNAEWFFVEIIAASRKGPGATPHAEIAKLTVPALPFQIICVAQLLKNGGLFPDLGEGLLVQVSCQNRQVSARVNLASVGDEA